MSSLFPDHVDLPNPSGNQSAAVVNQRREPTNSLDHFPTPKYATRALIELLARMPDEHAPIWAGAKDRGDTVLEPACAQGYMVEALGEHFGPDAVLYSDIHDYGYDGYRGAPILADFSVEQSEGNPWEDNGVDWVVTNPPFNKAAEFVHQGLRVSRKGLALLCRMNFVESATRWDAIFANRQTRPTCAAVFVNRLGMFKDVVNSQDSSATTYAWFIWDKARLGDTRLVWLSQHKSTLIRGGDDLLPPNRFEPRLFDMKGGA